MRLCVIGSPVGHSLSPLLHGAMLRRCGIAGDYQTLEVTPDTLPDFLRAARRGQWDGCNVTMPLKQAILPQLDELSPEAAACGAVNTVCFRHGRAIGYNTDATGIRRSLSDWGVPPEGRALLLGNGGAARAARWALGDRPLRCAARRGGDLPLEELPRGAEGCVLLLNATPLGMQGYPALRDFAFLDELLPGAAVFDLVYHPRETELLRQARQRGLAAIGGLELLVRQAIDAFVHFTGTAVDPETMREYLMNLLAEYREKRSFL